MKYIFAIIAITLTLSAYSQNKDFRLKGNDFSKTNMQFPSLSIKMGADSNTKTETTTVKKSKKSPGLAFIYSLLIPGMGHAYANKFETGKYFLISEAAIWLTYIGFSVYGNWVRDDAYNYSTIHAGVDLSGKEKDDKFFNDIANYDNVYQYNDEKLRFGEYDKIYDPASGYYFYWDNTANREIYQDGKFTADRTLNDRLFVIGAAVINHIISAISAVFAANSYNDEISKKTTGGLTMKAGVTKHYNRIDGIALKFIKTF
jgi:hypothetical protein